MSPQNKLRKSVLISLPVSLYLGLTVLNVCLISTVPSAPAQAQDMTGGGGQVLDDSNGDTFMEEVVSDKPKKKLPSVPIDLSRVGVSVDPHGNIVPLKDNVHDPWAASGVKPFYNHIETSTTLPYGYGGGAGYGYGGGAGYGYGGGFGYGGFGGYGGYPRYGAYGGYGGFGSYPGYGGYPGYGRYGYGQGSALKSLLGAALIGGGAGLYSASTGRYPYSFGNPGYYPGGFGYGNPYYGGLAPYGGGYVTSGNSATFISNDPTTGAPIAQGPGSNSQTNFSSSAGSFSPGPWLGPTTNFQQNSMWKAFNLGF